MKASFDRMVIQFIEAIHQVLFKIVKPSNREFKPITMKMHHLLHYSEQVERFGPLKHTSTLRYERGHQTFKNIASTSCNTINVPFTLAERYCLLFDLSSFFHDSTHSKKCTYIPSSLLESKLSSDVLRHIALDQDATILNDCQIRGVLFKPGFYYALKAANSFSIVKCNGILLQKNGTCNSYILLGYDCTICKYSIQSMFISVKPTPKLIRFTVDDLFYPNFLKFDLISGSTEIFNDFYFECTDNCITVSL